jgi:hypothetical protein
MHVPNDNLVLHRVRFGSVWFGAGLVWLELIFGLVCEPVWFMNRFKEHLAFCGS